MQTKYQNLFWTDPKNGGLQQQQQKHPMIWHNPFFLIQPNIRYCDDKSNRVTMKFSHVLFNKISHTYFELLAFLTPFSLYLRLSLYLSWKRMWSKEQEATTTKTRQKVYKITIVA